MKREIFFRHIRTALGIHTLIPVTFVIVLIIITSQVPILNCFFPAQYTPSDNLSTMGTKVQYIDCSADILYYTGYDYMVANKIKGHYYYSLVEDQCTIYLLSSDYLSAYGANTPATINNVSFKAKLLADEKLLQDLLTLMAGDLNWTYNGIAGHTSTWIVSQYHYTIYPVIALSVLLCTAYLFALTHFVILLASMVNPYHARIVFTTLRPSKQHTIQAVCEELESDAAMRFDEYLYLTKNYLICPVPYDIHIIPIQDITQIYYYTTLHGLPMRRHMATALFIKCSRRYQCKIKFVHQTAAAALVDVLKNHNTAIEVGLPVTSLTDNAHKNRDTIPLSIGQILSADHTDTQKDRHTSD